jgi:hypothetical protein
LVLSAGLHGVCEVDWGPLRTKAALRLYDRGGFLHVELLLFVPQRFGRVDT